MEGQEEQFRRLLQGLEPPCRYEPMSVRTRRDKTTAGSPVAFLCLLIDDGFELLERLFRVILFLGYFITLPDPVEQRKHKKRESNAHFAV